MLQTHDLLDSLDFCVFHDLVARPETANDKAESPSVRIRVHLCPSLVPALFASSSLGYPVSLLFLLPSFFFNALSAFAAAMSITLSRIPEASTFFTNESGSSSFFPPNWDALVVSCSLVWDVKAGFSTKQFTKRNMLFLIWNGLIMAVLLFFLICSWIFATSRLVTNSTCVPPEVVAIEFTKETWLKLPSEIEKAISHLSSMTWCTIVGNGSGAGSGLMAPSSAGSDLTGTSTLWPLAFSSALTYSSTYCLKLCTLRVVPFRLTFTPFTEPHRSYTLLLKTPRMSLSRVSIPNFAKSGLKMISVYSSCFFILVIFGLPASDMLFLHLGSVTVSSTSDFSLVVIVITRGEQVTKDQLWDINLFFGMDLDRNTSSVISDGDRVILCVDLDVDLLHRWVSNFVICSIDQNLVKDLEQTRNNVHKLFFHGLTEDFEPLVVFVELERGFFFGFCGDGVADNEYWDSESLILEVLLDRKKREMGNLEKFPQRKALTLESNGPDLKMTGCIRLAAGTCHLFW
ncbi:hypothetical protein OGAPHI_005244 [Ogataea philodendri]|uniref:Transmembrane protein n=1 Tax=Ogataea philodendri TaxID=1378263 RepID=A0A9P8T2N5_9ASCO|nr:uncharacterized protein OGAPHI_005244 [Ogataea philodendri]KAH3663841.1 hypothetical protein OGAPHI_005244 [Ogataea philodendri]